jgi:asparagine synthase (glutamine-hydrolysing)
MSGFAGMVNGDGSAPDVRVLERMAAGLAFRGPDAKQTSVQPDAGFCFTLLRTGPAPQEESQPCSIDGRVWLLGDVRLDGREELRRELEQRGERISAEASDEALILCAWRQWGEEGSFERLRGDFAFTIWDSVAKTLWCARDVMGVRPFVYARVEKWLYFSNTLDVLRLAPDVTGTIDRRFVGDFLLQGFCQDAETTAFRDIRRLPQGHFLKFKAGEMAVRRYAALPIEEPLWLRHDADYVEQFRGLLEQAVRERLPRGPAAIFMSGGLDSTSVAAQAVRIAKERDSQHAIRAYTVDLRPLFADEEAFYAERAGEHLGIPVEVRSIGHFKPFANWSDANLRLPEPSHEAFLMPHRELCREIATHARVALTGDGGDDILTGQAWPYFKYLLRRGRIGAIAGVFGSYVLKHGRIPPLHGGFRTRWRRWTGRRDALEGYYPAWLNSKFESEQKLRERWRELYEPPKAIHPLHPNAYASLTSPFWAYIKEEEDAPWTGAALENRGPLLDLRVIRFLLRVPPVPWCMEKALLRDAMTGVLPEAVVMRKKTPLQAEPLQLFEKERGWTPAPLTGPEQFLDEFVDCKKLGATLSGGSGSSLWVDLRAISLMHWLKGVEKVDWIQYSQSGRPE